MFKKRSLSTIKALCYATILLLVLAGQSVIAHNIDFDQAHHVHHDCQSYQNINGDLNQQIALACFPHLASEKYSLELTDSPLLITFIIRVRGPPCV